MMVSSIQEALNHLYPARCCISDPGISEHYKELDLVESNSNSKLCQLKMNYYNIETWGEVMKHVASNQKGIVFVPFIDYLFPELILTPWIGVMHYGLKSNDHRTSKKMLDNLGFMYSLKYCIALIVMSPDLYDFWKDYAKCWLIPHPIEISIEIKDYNPTILLSVGNFYRDLNKFKGYQTFLEKIRLDKNISTNTGFKTITFLNQPDYYKLLSRAVVFCVTTDLVACVTVLECITLKIPIIIQKCPASIFYLGKDYPMYYDDTLDLNLELIFKTREYLFTIKTLTFQDFKLEIESKIETEINSLILSRHVKQDENHY